MKPTNSLKLGRFSEGSSRILQISLSLGPTRYRGLGEVSAKLMNKRLVPNPQ